MLDNNQCCNKNIEDSKLIYLNPIQKLMYQLTNQLPNEDYKKFAYYFSFITISSVMATVFSNHIVAVSMLCGAAMQGYYHCKPQIYIAKHHPTAAYVAGAIDGLLCCGIQYAIFTALNCILPISTPLLIITPLVIWTATTLIHTYFASKSMYMCSVEAVIINACQNGYLPNGPNYTNADTNAVEDYTISLPWQ